MSKKKYHWVDGYEREDIDDAYEILFSPTGEKVAMITEPEDRYSYRDLAPITDELNTLNDKVRELEESVEVELKANSEALDRENELCEKVRELTGMLDHGNGAILLQWMDAHSKACDRADAAEAKVRELEEKQSAWLKEVKRRRELHDRGNYEDNCYLDIIEMMEGE